MQARLEANLVGSLSVDQMSLKLQCDTKSTSVPTRTTMLRGRPNESGFQRVPRRQQAMSVKPSRHLPLSPVIRLIVQASCYLILLSFQETRHYTAQCANIAPTIDYSHNMRILKLPKSTPAGSLIYRLKASDPDPGAQLVFGVSGIEGRSLLDVQPVARSWNEADVYLRSLLEQSQYNVTIFVTDGNMTTQVESTVLVTDNELGQPLAAIDSPFVNTKHLFRVPESAQPNEPIGTVTALESQKSDLPVRFELRGKGAEKFSIRYVFGPHQGQSRAEIVLAQRVDFEKQNLFALKILALNAWTDTRFDTRNVAAMDIVVTLSDVQDTPPVFKNLPQSLKLANNLSPGDLVAQLEAEDGDYADQRQVSYTLDVSSPLAAYFSIDRLSGELRLAKPIGELLAHAAWSSEPGWSQLIVLASEQPDASSYDHLWPPMFARAELPLLLIDQLNEPPRLLGGWQTGSGNDRTLHGFLVEPKPDELCTAGSSQTADCSQPQVHWYTNTSTSSSTSLSSALVDQLLKSLGNKPIFLDLGLGANGTFELTLSGRDAHLFQLEPSFPVSRQTTFGVSVASGVNRTLFDLDTAPKHRSQFSFDILAKDFGSAQRQSAQIHCLIELLDANDNAPQFDSDLFAFNVYENAVVGSLIGQVRAQDPDANFGPIRYTSLTGRDTRLFRLDALSGQIFLDAPLDRERTSQYLFLVEAQDGQGHGNYSQVLINVLDVNDNAPIFLQSHYDAVLLADGTFHQPLVIRAVDADEPAGANSQVAYEIIAGNQNEQFIIDSLSGVIYPSLGGSSFDASHPDSTKTGLPKIPPALIEPIIPYAGHAVSGSAGPEPAGKILPSHEVEESRAPIATSLGPRQRLETSQISRNLSAPPLDVEQLPALDLLLNLESQGSPTTATPPEQANKHQLNVRSLLGPGEVPLAFQSLKVPPVTSLIVRAHDFGVPVRSSTVRVNIYNQALLSRSISVIMNGTAELLEQRRDALERALSSLTGSKATVESIDSLSESSSLSVARVRLAVPPHSLVDLTDLSSLLSALDYKHPAQQVGEQHFRHQEQPGAITHYVATGDKVVPTNGPLQQAIAAGNLTGLSPTNSNLFNDIQSYAIEASGLERRLLIYIIIVAVCILALLLIWMIYSCSKESEQVKFTEAKMVERQTDNYRSTASGDDPVDLAVQGDSVRELATKPKTNELSGEAASPIGKNLAKATRGLPDESSTVLMMNHRASNLSAHTTTLKPDHFSMYNGQVWFTPAGAMLGPMRCQSPAQRARPFGSADRRASSAPSGGSLDSALHSTVHSPGYRQQHFSRDSRKATGQFFPNTIGYMDNLAAMHQAGMDFELERARHSTDAAQSQSLLGRRHRKRRVAPASLDQGPLGASNKPPRLSMATSSGGGQVNEAFEHDSGPGHQARVPAGDNRRNRHRASASLSSGANSAGSMTSMNLDSDQELLGFDSTGTPIIATHTRAAANLKPLVLDAGHQQRPSLAKTSAVVQGPKGTPAPSGESQSVANKPPSPEMAARTDTPVQVVPESSIQQSQIQSAEQKPIRRTSQDDLMSELNGKLDKRRKASEAGSEPAIREDNARAEAGGLRDLSSAGSTGTTEEQDTAPDKSNLDGMKNGELLERQSIFALTYSGLATDKPPS